MFLQVVLPPICGNAPGGGEPPALQMGTLFEETPSRTASFLLKNTSTTAPLEATLTANDCVGLVELNFTCSPYDPPVFCRNVVRVTHSFTC